MVFLGLGIQIMIIVCQDYIIIVYSLQNKFKALQSIFCPFQQKAGFQTLEHRWCPQHIFLLTITHHHHILYHFFNNPNFHLGPIWPTMLYFAPSTLYSFIKRHSEFKQQFYTKRVGPEKNMLNQSSENDSYMGRNDSDELLLNKKYSRKTKFIKKKSQEMGSVPSRKKKCPQFDKGMCPNGALCSYSHSFIPDIAKKQCKNYGINLCKKGEFCPFSHNLSRFPCKQLFILGNCSKGRSCQFSHKEIDPDFYQDFFGDNLDFILDALEEGKQLAQECLQFSRKTDIHSRIKKQSELQNEYRFPIFFGVSVTRSASVKGSNNQNSSKQKMPAKAQSKKQLRNQKPFSIRLASKNRTVIPEQLFQPITANLSFKRQQDNLEHRQSWDQKQQSENEDNMISEKIHQGINLTPSQRVFQVPHQNFFHQF